MTVIYEEDFDDGTHSFNVTSGNLSIVSTPARGIYSCKFYDYGGVPYGTKNYSPDQSEQYIRFYVWFEDTGDYGEVFRIRDLGNSDLASFTFDGTNLDCDISGGTEYGSESMNLNEWNLIEIYILVDTTSGVLQTKINGTLDIDYSGNTNYPDAYTGFHYLTWRCELSLATLYVDGIITDDADWVGHDSGGYFTFGDMALAGTGEVDIAGIGAFTFGEMTQLGVTTGISIDTIARRAAVLQYLKPYSYVWPMPDSLISQSDRMHLLSLFPELAEAGTGAVFGPEWQSG